MLTELKTESSTGHRRLDAVFSTESLQQEEFSGGGHNLQPFKIKIKLNYYGDGKQIPVLGEEKNSNVDSKQENMNNMESLLSPKPENLEDLSDYGRVEAMGNHFIANMDEYGKKPSRHGGANNSDQDIDQTFTSKALSDTSTDINEVVQTVKQTTKSKSRLKGKTKDGERKQSDKKARNKTEKRVISETAGGGSEEQRAINSIDEETYALMNEYLQCNVCEKYLETEAKLRVSEKRKMFVLNVHVFISLG